MTQSQFQLAIIGRPNVGKSTLFNKLIKKRKALVAKEPGVTRDYQEGKIVWNNHEITILDTSGYEIPSVEVLQRRSPILSDAKNLSDAIDLQYEKVMKQSHAFLFVCDGQSEITQLDHELLEKVRQQNKPIFFAVNKVDTTHFRTQESDYYQFLGEDFLKISAERNMGLDEILDTIDSTVKLPELKTKELFRETRIAIMGRPNVGKSTLFNHLLNEERAIVSPVPGTTRDALDMEISYDGEKYIFIDTAGLRKKRKITDRVERLSSFSALASLDRAQILLLVLDAVEGPTEQEIKIASMAWKRGVAVVLLVNKWDLLPMEKRTNTYWQKVIWNKFRHFDRLPFLFVSGLEKRNLNKIFSAILETKTFYNQVIDPHELMESFKSWTTETPHPLHIVLNRRARVKFFSIKQFKNAPPGFEVKTNFPDSIRPAYARFLINQIRQKYGFWGVPIEIVYKK